MGLILLVVTILGNIIAFKFKGLFHKVISIGLTISVWGLTISALLLIGTDNAYIITGSFITITLLSITTFIYGLTIKEVNNFEKISIITMFFFLIVISFFQLFHWPFAGLIKLSMIIPIIITLTAFIKGRRLTKEMSFMIFWLFYVISKILIFWTL